jgi:hypothetical protein
MVAGEIESLQATLTEKEFTVKLMNSNDFIAHILNLSIVPNFDGKITAKN